MEAEKKLVDWSKHRFTETKYPLDDKTNLFIYQLKIPDTSHGMVKFVNFDGVCTVMGDYGNWVFNREFHPKAKSYQAFHYFKEKLEIASCQKVGVYDSEETCNDLLKELARYCEEYKIDPENTEDEYVEYLKSCIEVSEDELDYTYTAYRTYPSNMDSESVIFRKKPLVWFSIIYEAFHEMCGRLDALKTDE